MNRFMVVRERRYEWVDERKHTHAAIEILITPEAHPDVDRSKWRPVGIFMTAQYVLNALRWELPK